MQASIGPLWSNVSTITYVWSSFVFLGVGVDVQIKDHTCKPPAEPARSSPD
jgi:hypothetical protein